MKQQHTQKQQPGNLPTTVTTTSTTTRVVTVSCSSISPYTILSYVLLFVITLTIIELYSETRYYYHDNDNNNATSNTTTRTTKLGFASSSSSIHQTLERIQYKITNSTTTVSQSLQLTTILTALTPSTTAELTATEQGEEFDDDDDNNDDDDFTTSNIGRSSIDNSTNVSRTDSTTSNNAINVTNSNTENQKNPKLVVDVPDVVLTNNTTTIVRKQDNTNNSSKSDGTKISTTTTTTNNNHNKQSSSSSSTTTGTTKLYNLSRTDEYIETIEVGLYNNNLKYHRVCTSVGLSSILCITMRYPFDVLPQNDSDPTIRYPTPVTDEIYKIKDQNNIHSITKSEWNTCLQQYYNQKEDDGKLVTDDVNENDIQQIIYNCLESISTTIGMKRKDQQEPVTFIYTRRNNNPKNTKQIPAITQYAGYGYKEAYERIYNFFGNNHEILVAGASPAPGVTYNLQKFFSNTCRNTGVNKQGNYDCFIPSWVVQANKDSSNTNNNNTAKTNPNKRQYHRQLGNLPYSRLQEPAVNIGVFTYNPPTRNFKHYVPTQSVMDALTVLNVSRSVPATPENPYRNFSFFVEYPFAHIQDEQMIIDENQTTVWAIQQKLHQYYMELINTDSTEKFHKRGYSFQNLFFFDGLPQFFPTQTSGYHRGIGATTQSKFYYTGYNKAYGTTCRGPLPTNSILKEINNRSRQLLQQTPYYNMQFYSRTWEFTNLFWFQMKLWNGKNGGLDCTHAVDWNTGFYGVHPYFVQAIVDDYFENQYMDLDNKTKNSLRFTH